MTKSINAAIDVTKSRRAIQEEHNKIHGITPKTIKKEKGEGLFEDLEVVAPRAAEGPPRHLAKEDISAKIKEYETEMKRAAKELRFEDAAHFRDQLQHYQKLELLEGNL